MEPVLHSLGASHAATEALRPRACFYKRSRRSTTREKPGQQDPAEPKINKNVNNNKMNARLESSLNLLCEMGLTHRLSWRAEALEVCFYPFGSLGFSTY